jgi:hypothetical protein
MSSIYNSKTEGVVLWYNGGVGQGLSETLQGNHAGKLLEKRRFRWTFHLM